LEHLPGPYPRKRNPEWDPRTPCARRWLTSKGHKSVHHYRSRLDRMEVDGVRFSTYGDHRDVHPFNILCTYSGWLMRGKERVYRHLPERVKRQFSFVQDVPRHPSAVPQVPTQMLTTVLMDARPWLVPAWVDGCETPWQHVPGYMAWYARVSHPRILPPDEGSPPRPTNVEQLIVEEHAREMPDTLTIVRDVAHIARDIVARHGEMTKEEVVQEVMRIVSATEPALIYQISRRRRGQQRQGRQG
jgi:hypothetical protein